jgi:hypothetical protein
MLRKLHREDHELEAESFAYALGRAYGIDWDRAGWYLGGWAHGRHHAIRGAFVRAGEKARAFLDARRCA